MATVAFPSHWAGVAEIVGLLWLEGSYFQWMGLRKASILCYKPMIIFTYKRHPDMVGVRELIFISLSSDTHYLWTQSHNEFFLLKKNWNTARILEKLNLTTTLECLFLKSVCYLFWDGDSSFLFIHLFACFFGGKERGCYPSFLKGTWRTWTFNPFPEQLKRALEKVFLLKPSGNSRNRLNVVIRGPGPMMSMYFLDKFPNIWKI